MTSCPTCAGTPGPVRVRSLGEKDVPEAARLVREAFTETVAPLYSGAGVESFLEYADEQRMVRRLSLRHVLLGAFLAGYAPALPAGVMELRLPGHISLFFVLTRFQRMGVGRALLGQALARLPVLTPGVESVTVNASPNAVPAYRRFGFSPTGPEKTDLGIRFTPMERPL